MCLLSLLSALSAQNAPESEFPQPMRYRIQDVSILYINLGQEKVGFVEGMGIVIIEPKKVRLSGSGARILLLELKKLNEDETIDRHIPIDPIGMPYLCWATVTNTDAEYIDSFPIYPSSNIESPILYNLIKLHEPNLDAIYRNRLKEFMSPKQKNDNKAG